MPGKLEIIGLRFARAIVLSDAPPGRNGRRRVLCKCDCGNTFECEPRYLTNGASGSCGCRQRDRAADSARARATHRATGTPEYRSWVHIKMRCENPKNRKFPDYGGRGIKVCAEWREDFEAFFRDMGRKPSLEASVDRVNVNGDYEPANCRWASRLEQARNKRRHRMVAYGKALIPLSEACERAGVNYRSALYRLNQGKHWMPLPPPPSDAGDG